MCAGHEKPKEQHREDKPIRSLFSVIRRMTLTLILRRRVFWSSDEAGVDSQFGPVPDLVGIAVDERHSFGSHDDIFRAKVADRVTLSVQTFYRVG